MDFVYKGWDVHSYTKDLNNIDVRHFNVPVSPDEAQIMFIEIDKIIPVTSHRAKQALNKIKQRYSPGVRGYIDPDIHVNVIYLLKMVWELVKSIKDDSIERLFIETLDDIGSTCIQGDSHRLIFLYFALFADSH